MYTLFGTDGSSSDQRIVHVHASAYEFGKVVRAEVTVHAGPNAVLALAREGYNWSDISLRDMASTLVWPGTARLLRRYWRPGLDEMIRSLSRHRFMTAARLLVPGLDSADVRRAPAGVRAQAVDRGGTLLDDFHLLDGDRSLHVLNAPSPAATASLEIGMLVADRVVAGLAH